MALFQLSAWSEAAGATLWTVIGILNGEPSNKTSEGFKSRIEWLIIHRLEFPSSDFMESF